MHHPPPQLTVVPAAPMQGGTMSFAERDDDELMLLARGGVVEAFATLVRRHQAKVLRVAARRLGRPAWAPDVAQSAFLDIYRAIARYQARGVFSAYLYRTVLNRCRLAERAARSQSRFSAELTRATATFTAGGQAPVASAEALVLARERERDVQDAVARLSAKLRDVVSLRYGGEMSYEEIALTLEVPLGTVKRRLFDAMETLRRMMEEDS